jgi:hypothetical protein
MKTLDNHTQGEETHMADRPPDPDTGVMPAADRPPSTPRWVKVFGIIVIAVVLLVVAMMFVGGGGEHGPARHAPSGDAGGQVPLSSVMEEYAALEGGRG